MKRRSAQRSRSSSSPRSPTATPWIFRRWFTSCSRSLIDFQLRFGGDMRILKTVVVVLGLSALSLSALPLHAAEDSALNQIVDRIISTENTEMNSFKAYSPLVETYIQNLR